MPRRVGRYAASPEKRRKPGRSVRWLARVPAGAPPSEVLPHPLRFMRSLPERHMAAQPAEGSPSTRCAATQSDPASSTAPHPHAQGAGSIAASVARALSWAASYPRVWREGRLRSHAAHRVPDGTRAGGCPLSQVRITRPSPTTPACRTGRCGGCGSTAECARCSGHLDGWSRRRTPRTASSRARPQRNAACDAGDARLHALRHRDERERGRRRGLFACGATPMGPISEAIA